MPARSTLLAAAAPCLHSLMAMPPFMAEGTSSEWNFSANGIGPSTNYTLQHWPAEVPIVFIGWFLGHDVRARPCCGDVSGAACVAHAGPLFPPG